jgi:hypothetical protein
VRDEYASMKAELARWEYWAGKPFARGDHKDPETEAADQKPSFRTVAWAVRNKTTGRLDTWGCNRGVALFATREFAEAHVSRLEDRFEVVPYPLEQGDTEFKDALARIERLEAEVAAWKKAAVHRTLAAVDMAEGYSPAALVGRIDNLIKQSNDSDERRKEAEAAAVEWRTTVQRFRPAADSPTHLAEIFTHLDGLLDKWRARVDKANAEVAAMHSRLAEALPLDHWRVMATAHKIAGEECRRSREASLLESAYGGVRCAIDVLLTIRGNTGAKAYPVAQED